MTNFEARLAALPPEKRALVLQQLKQKRAEAQNRIIAQPRSGQPFPLSYGQERMWFLYQLDPQSALYNVSVTVCLDGQLDVARLQQALTLLVERHEGLRTTFGMVDGRPMQQIATEATLALEIHDLTAVPEPEDTFYQQAQTALQRPFDLEVGPVFRAHLYQLTPQEARLLLVMHHIISDGWSVGILAKEMAELYRALSQNQPPTLPPLPIQAADFAVWQRQWLQGRNLETLQQYWQQQLADAPAMLELPTDHPRPAEQSFQGERLPFSLSDALYQQCKTASQQEGATLFMVLFTAFAILMGRLANQDDIIIGTPITNRKQPEVMGVVGAFVNTLALRVNLAGDPTYQQLLAQVKQTALDAYAHEAMPFAHLVDLLKLPRSLSHSPLFQLSFGLQDNPLQAIEMPGLSVSLLEVRSLLQEGALPPLDTGQAMFDLTFHLSEIAEGVGGWVEYSTDLFTAVTVEQIGRQYQALLAQLLVNPTRPLSQLSLLDPDGWQQLVVAWNQTTRPFAGPTTLHQLFEERATQFAHTTAVRQLDQHGQLIASLTFAELDQQANQLAHYLHQQGIGPGALVGLCAERTTQTAVAMLAILKAGAGYVPLPPDYPTERLLYMARDAQLALIFSETAQLSRLNAAQMPIFCLDRDGAQLHTLPSTAVETTVTADQVAYVIYTSGSTGQPKGVMVRHRNIVNLVHAQIDAFALTPHSRVLQFAVLGFDAAVSEIFTTLISGATLVLAPSARLVPGDEFATLLNQEAISSITLPPSALRVMDSRQLPHLQTVISAGEACPVDLARIWSQNRRFLNFYGPTEATVGCCYQLVDEALLTAVGDSLPIGRPIANVQLYVVDAYGQPLPPGVPGELWVGGAGVALGYLNRPELTADKFIADPFSGQPDGRLYRTGDRVRMDADGRLHFLGRTDHQLKLRGFRIELGEIEAVLAQHTAVAEAIVLPTTDDGRTHLTAYFLTSAEPAPTLSELRHFLGQQLPDYMIPAYFVPLTRWPLTANGKIDRHALASMTSDRLQATSDFASSRNEVEANLVAIWQALLQVEQVGIHDNFFELGGDSILSIQMVARARAQNIQLSPRQIFQHQTIAELAAVAAPVPGIQAEQGEVTGVVPLTAVQRWFLGEAPTALHHWNQAVMLQLPRPLQLPYLEAALAAVVQQHDALRLRFNWADGRWQQAHTVAEGTAVLQTLDLSAVPAEKQAQTVAQAVTAVHRALDFSQGPVLRLLYISGGADTVVRLLCVAHHLVVDAVSWRLLLEDLQTAYEQLSHGQPVRLPAKTTSFKQWATAVQAHAQSEAILATLPSWQHNQLMKPLPVDGTVAHNLVADEAIWQTTVDAAQTAALLQDVPSVYHTQMNDVLLTALLLAYYEWSQEKRLWIDLEGHGRESWDDALDISRTVGWFTTIYPVALQLESLQLGELLKSVKEQLRAIPHNGFSYGLLRYVNGGTAVALRQQPSPQISFNYLGQLGTATSDWQLSEEWVGETRQPNSARAHLIEIESQVRHGRLHTLWRYNPKLHHAATIQQLANRYAQQLSNLIAHCQNPDAGGYTPSDFPEARLDQQQLDNALAELFGD